MKYDFKSHFKFHIEGLLTQKHTLGFPYRASERYLREFDTMCLNEFPGETVLTNELGQKWGTARDTEKRVSFQNRMAPIRELAKYMIRLGVPAYIIESMAIPESAKRPIPHIFTDFELTAFFAASDKLEYNERGKIRHLRDESGIPAIVSRELFGKVQEMVEKNHKSPNQKAQSFLLAGKLKCGLCGEDMTGDGGTSHSGKTYAYYTCNKRKYDKSCEKERAPKDWIENLVIDKLIELLNTEGFIEMVADKAVEYQEQDRDRTVLDALEVRKKDNEKAIANVMAAIEAGIITPTTKSWLVELEAESANIDKGIAREHIDDQTISHDFIMFFLERFRDADMNDEKHRARLLQTFVNSVYLYDDDKLVLCFNFTDEHGKISKVTLSITMSTG